MMTQQGSEKQATLIASQKLNIDWQQVCQAIWQNSLSINSLTTQSKETNAQWEDPYFSWKLSKYNLQKNNEEFNNYSCEEKFSHYNQKEFCEQIISSEKNQQQQKLAIIGESSTGKTTILNQIISWILNNTDDLPIFISMAEIGETSLHQYLQEKWLKRVAKTQDELTKEWQNSLEKLLNSGRVWLLLDGVDRMPIEQIAKLPIAVNLSETQEILHNPLSTTIKQLQGWADKTKIILTCHSDVFAIDRHILSDFDVFRPLELTYPEQVKHFVTHWLSHSTSKKSGKLAIKCFQTLEQFGIDRIQPLIQIPSRLALLCRQLQQNQGNLPLTTVKVYEQLVTHYYQWKKEIVSLDRHQQQQLNQALSKLAVQGMNNTSHPSCLYHHQIIQELGEDETLLTLALRLGWLRIIGLTASKEIVYTFWDKTFQAYFAATAIDNGDFFLNHALKGINSILSSSSKNLYRIFEQQWKQVILFWIGREDLKKEDKEKFLKKLVEFNDGCETNNFYGKRAYFLATSALVEFPESEQTNEILFKLLQWSFFDDRVSPSITQAAKTALEETNRKWVIPALIQLLTTLKNETIKGEIFKTIEKIGQGNPLVLTALTEMLETNYPDFVQLQVAETLGIIDPGNHNAIATILTVLKTANHDETRQIAFNSLEKIGKGNLKAITTLIKWIQQENSSLSQQRAFETLETIGYGNATATAVLIQLIRTKSDEEIRLQAAESLEKVDPGNPIVFTVLEGLIHNTSNEEIKKKAVYSLGEITPGKVKAIDILIKILSENTDLFIRWMAVSSLGKIGMGNSQVSSALISLIKLDEQELLCKEAIESLSKIDPDNPELITALIELIELSKDESTQREAIESLGKIALGNSKAIVALAQLLRNTSDEFILQETASSLSKINPGNLEALKTLIKLIQSSVDPDVRNLVIKSLGENWTKNPAAIAILIRLTKTTRDPKILKKTALSLGKIAIGNREAISALVQLIKSDLDESCRLQAADSLINLIKPEQMSEVVISLKEFVSDFSTQQDLAGQQIIWHCVQQLSYPDFYQAWHNRPLCET